MGFDHLLEYHDSILFATAGTKLALGRGGQVAALALIDRIPVHIAIAFPAGEIRIGAAAAQRKNKADRADSVVFHILGPRDAAAALAEYLVRLLVIGLGRADRNYILVFCAEQRQKHLQGMG